MPFGSGGGFFSNITKDQDSERLNGRRSGSKCIESICFWISRALCRVISVPSALPLRMLLHWNLNLYWHVYDGRYDSVTHPNYFVGQSAIHFIYNGKSRAVTS
jgi:hypothetical protein